MTYEIIPKNPYSATADKLVEHLLEIIPRNLNILKITNVWDLFKIKDFDCQDLQPSLFQAQWALLKAKEIYRTKVEEIGDSND